jgi:hypothetical protein
LTNLLAAPVPEVAAAALQTFQVLVRKAHHTSLRWTPPAGLTQRLLALSKGWGGKDEGLDLVLCASSDETAVRKVRSCAFAACCCSCVQTAVGPVDCPRRLCTTHH